MHWCLYQPSHTISFSCTYWTLEEQKHWGAQLLNMLHELWWWFGESFYQHAREGTNKCCFGLPTWYDHKWYHPQSDNFLPKA
ncbi:hypothetical protein OIU79_018933 [Salix purpurea]|uniref:Uncharacterized protein n=1 Tax=Salix purpurea TaxID=77065 RepID=A0A9Q0NZY5_SALPP|nr:hypothetical protein OIU79_018933 [Salix purpurea]